MKLVEQMARERFRPMDGRRFRVALLASLSGDAAAFSLKSTSIAAASASFACAQDVYTYKGWCGPALITRWTDPR